MNIKERFQLFVNNTINNSQEVSSKSALYQCMDLAYQWVNFLNYPKSTIQNGYAYQVYTNPKAITKEYFELIPNTPEFIPQVGDIVVWDKKINGYAGHIEIVSDKGATVNYFYGYGQNWDSDYPRITKHNYNYVIGFLRPKKFYIDEETAKEVKKLQEKLDDRNDDYESLKIEFNKATNELQKELEQREKDYDIIEDELIDEQKSCDALLIQQTKDKEKIKELTEQLKSFNEGLIEIPFRNNLIRVSIAPKIEEGGDNNGKS